MFISFYSNNDETEVLFCIERFGSQKEGRVVKYDLKNKHFSCSCYHMNFSGIICRHIFKVITQLNLEEIPHHLFPIRWRKDPNDNVLVKMYKTFYNNREIEMHGQNEHINVRENDYEDYNYLLNRTWYKAQQIIKAKPETAKNFYFLLDKLVKEISLNTSEKTTQNSETIKNSATLKTKGKFYFLLFINFNLLIYLKKIKDAFQKEELKVSLKLLNLLKD